MEKLQYDLFYIKHMSSGVRPVHRARDDQDRAGPRGLVADDDAGAQCADGGRRGLLPGIRRSPTRLPSRSGSRCESRVCRNTERLLGIFEEAGERGDVFRVGVGRRTVSRTCQAHPRRRSRTRVPQLRSRPGLRPIPESFAADLRRAQDAIEDACGARVVRGYRAPSFSITERSLWALDVLVAEGYRYDSSIYPIRHDRYGIPTWSRHIHRVNRRTAVRSGSCRVRRLHGPA